MKSLALGLLRSSRLRRKQEGNDAAANRTPGIAHYASVLAGGSHAAVIDPRWDVEAYLSVARELGVRIRYVIETHRQEDFVMRSPEPVAAR